MHKPLSRRPLLILALLTLFALAVRYGANWYMAGRLDPIALTEIGDEEGVLWMLNWRPELVLSRVPAGAGNQHGFALLHLAAHHGRLRIIHALLDTGVAPGTLNEWGDTPLHYAAYGNQLRAAKLLIDAGANVSPKGNLDSSPLDVAVSSGHYTVAKAILAAGGRSTSVLAIEKAVRGADCRAVALLLDSGGDPETPDRHLNSLLHQTCRSLQLQSAQVARILVRHGAQPNPLNTRGKTPLDVVLQDGVYGATYLVLRQVHVMQELGCESAYSNAYPLHAAASNGDVEILRKRIAQGASVCRRTVNEKSPIRDEQLPFLTVLPDLTYLESALGVSGRITTGETPLHRAKSADVVHVLIEAGADVNMPDATGKTPVMRAYLTGYLRDLLRRKATLDVRRSPSQSWNQYDPTAVSVLLNAGADANHRDHTGRTLLHYAAMLAHPRVIRRCIEAGANVNAADPGGSRPLDYLDAARRYLGAKRPSSIEQAEKLLKASHAQHGKPINEFSGRPEEVLSSSNLPM